MKKINVYDFDETIYDGDASINFFKYSLQKNLLLIKYLPIQIYGVILYVFKIYKKKQLKEKFFSFLKGIKDINQQVLSFWEHEKKKIKKWYSKTKSNNDVIISASPKFLLEPICEELKVSKVIATCMDSKTGKIMGENCHGKEKVNRLNKEYKDYEILNFYSDSDSDLPLMKISKTAYKIKKDKVYSWEETNQENIINKAKRIFLSKKFAIFLFIGVINTINGIAFSYIYSLIFDNNLSFILGYITSLTIAYLLNSWLNFKEKLNYHKYVKFCISYIPNFIIQNIVVVIFLNILHYPKILAYSIAATLGIPITFLFVSFYAFTSKK